jgi:high-affinity iron transporter
MIATALIVFREVLEAALIVGIVSAATRGIPGRTRWIAGGMGAGLLGSILVAAGANVITQLAQGMGQELFNAAILALAVVMLAWHNIWMSSHGRELAANARRIGADVRSGASELSVVLVVIGIAVLREGSETVLFLYGVAASGDTGSGSMVAGGLLGIACGVAVGYLLFRGLLRIPLKWFFNVTSALVLFLAAGMAAQAARFLVQADVLPSLANPLWDTSSLVSNSSTMGKALTGLVGYDAQPAGMQILAFVLVLVAIALGMAWVRRRDQGGRSGAPAPSST